MVNYTEKWRKGELKTGWYYVKNEFGSIFVSEYSKGYDHINERIEKDFFTEVSDITEIICEVPSYEKWQQMKAFCEEFNALEVAEENRSLKEKLEPFTDPYFRGLTTKDIAELAKKSIRLTTQHCEDTTTIFNLKELLCCCADELEAIEDKDIEIERLLEEIEKELK